MAFLVFDIETAALPFDSFDEVQREYLMRGLETEEEREKQKAMMSLNGLTAQVVCIGMLYVESLEAEPKAFLYSTNPTIDVVSTEETLDDGTRWRQMPERELLERWWEVLGSKHVHLISFNGRGFDCPFLMLRSAALGIRYSRNLMEGTKWRYAAHTDLQDELAFFGFSSGLGPLKRFNFDFYCKTFGITSPKDEGVTGDMVPKLFGEGEYRTIGEYCMRDVSSTWELYKYWKRYLS